jgi:hypothetical protein
MEKPPQKTKIDAAYALAEVVASAVPYIGGPLATILDVVGPPLERRREKWLFDLADRIAELQGRVGELSRPLDENDAFISAVQHATQIAMRSHQDEKLEALKNAVTNSALVGAPGDDLQLMFLRFIDELTPWHLRILSLFDNPPAYLELRGTHAEGIASGGCSILVERCHPDLRGQSEFIAQLVRDLQSRGLLAQGNFLNVTMTGHGLISQRSTALGRELIRFITRPPAAN